MTEEEKKAIKYLKNEIERVNKENNFKKMPKEIVCIPLFLTYSETLLNLIEKLQKEIEELKKPKDNIQVVYGSRNYGKTNSIVKEYISKDKIREKIKDLQKDYNNDVFIGYEKITGEAIKKLKELLEEE